jgi:hypothetical protein
MIHEVLASRSWMIKVQRGYPGYPLGGIVYYRYTFTFASTQDEKKVLGKLLIETVNAQGDLVRMTEGITRKPVQNPFILYYFNEGKQALIDCKRLHAYQTKDSKVQYEYHIQPSMQLACRLEKSVWIIEGSYEHIRQLFTPNQWMDDGFGLLTPLFAQTADIRVAPEAMEIRVFAGNLLQRLQLNLCCSVTDDRQRFLEGAETDPDMVDLESQLLVRVSEKRS